MQRLCGFKRTATYQSVSSPISISVNAFRVITMAIAILQTRQCAHTKIARGRRIHGSGSEETHLCRSSTTSERIAMQYDSRGCELLQSVRSIFSTRHSYLCVRCSSTRRKIVLTKLYRYYHFHKTINMIFIDLQPSLKDPANEREKSHNR